MYATERYQHEESYVGGAGSGARSVVRRPGSSTLYDVLELLLDRGLVVDAYVRVSLVGVELVTVDLRVVLGSVDTYLRFAERADRLIIGVEEPAALPDMISGSAKRKTEGAIEGAREALGSDDDEDGRGMLGRVKDRLTSSKKGEESGDEEDEEEQED